MSKLKFGGLNNPTNPDSRKLDNAHTRGKKAQEEETQKTNKKPVESQDRYTVGPATTEATNQTGSSARGGLLRETTNKLSGMMAAAKRRLNTITSTSTSRRIRPDNKPLDAELLAYARKEHAKMEPDPSLKRDSLLLGGGARTAIQTAFQKPNLETADFIRIVDNIKELNNKNNSNNQEHITRQKLRLVELFIGIPDKHGDIRNKGIEALEMIKDLESIESIQNVAKTITPKDLEDLKIGRELQSGYDRYKQNEAVIRYIKAALEKRIFELEHPQEGIDKITAETKELQTKKRELEQQIYQGMHTHATHSSLNSITKTLKNLPPDGPQNIDESIKEIYYQHKEDILDKLKKDTKKIKEAIENAGCQNIEDSKKATELSDAVDERKREFKKNVASLYPDEELSNYAKELTKAEYAIYQHISNMRENKEISAKERQSLFKEIHKILIDNLFKWDFPQETREKVYRSDGNNPELLNISLPNAENIRELFFEKFDSSKYFPDNQKDLFSRLKYDEDFPTIPKINPHIAKLFDSYKTTSKELESSIAKERILLDEKADINRKLYRAKSECEFLPTE